MQGLLRASSRYTAGIAASTSTIVLDIIVERVNTVCDLRSHDNPRYIEKSPETSTKARSREVVLMPYDRDWYLSEEVANR